MDLGVSLQLLMTILVLVLICLRKCHTQNSSVLRNCFITETEEMWDGVGFWIESRNSSDFSKRGLMHHFPGGKGRAVFYGSDPIRRFPMGFFIKLPVNSRCLFNLY